MNMLPISNNMCIPKNKLEKGESRTSVYKEVLMNQQHIEFTVLTFVVTYVGLEMLGAFGVVDLEAFCVLAFE